jgi:hypothetical protein
MSVKAKQQRAKARLQARIQRKIFEGNKEYFERVNKPKPIGNGLNKLIRVQRESFLIRRENKVEYLRRNEKTTGSQDFNSNSNVNWLKVANPKDMPFRHLTFYGIESVEKLKLK